MLNLTNQDFPKFLEIKNFYLVQFKPL